VENLNFCQLYFSMHSSPAGGENYLNFEFLLLTLVLTFKLILV